MEIILAESAGFCFGVSRAVETVYSNIGKYKMATIGPIIHNNHVVNDLLSKGVRIVEDLKDINDEMVIIRSHGVCKEVLNTLNERKLQYIDCTCPYVKKIHNIVRDSYEQGKAIIIIGDKYHPEVLGINSCADNTSIVISSLTDISNVKFDINKEYTLVIQTTFRFELYEEILNALNTCNLQIKVYNTICNATVLRQNEAEKISKLVDIMIVFGDKSSSNTTKLYEICKKNCKKTYFLENIHEIELKNISTNVKIGITAGASTPSDIIKEAINFMSDVENTTQSFEEMLNESFVTLHTGDVVKGHVIQVTSAEASVNLGYKSDGVITRSEYSDEPNVDLTKHLKPGDEIEVYVLRVNDGEGNVLLSRKRLEAQKGWEKIEQSFNSKEPITGRFVDVVKGGMIASINGVRVFVPSSQVSNKYTEDFKALKGVECAFNIIEFDRAKRKVVAGRKELANKEAKEKKDKVYATLEVGSKVEGIVNRLVDFGAFVDLGGVDGLIHISQMSWGRVKKAKDILNEGDKVIVTVLEIDKDNSKISLSLKDLNNDPWLRATEKYIIGEIVEGKVVRMANFGAFVELEQGVDGLVHVSQISEKHVPKPEDALKIGDIIKVKITEVDVVNKRISLSKKQAEGVKVDEAENNTSDTSMDETKTLAETNVDEKNE